MQNEDPYIESRSGWAGNSSTSHNHNYGDDYEGVGGDADGGFDDETSRLEHEERVAGPADLYAILNVDRDASDEDIRNAYRRLSMTFHPDKHHSPEDKELAQHQFQSIKKAYDILSNPNRRHIYDSYGADGLQSSWDVTEQRGQTAQQARDEFERMQRQRLETEAERLVKSKGEVHIGLDATGCFGGGRRKRRPNTSSYGGLFDSLAFPEISHAFVKHSWDTKIVDGTDLTIQGSVITKNGMGAGTVVATIRRIIDPTCWTETSFQASMKTPSATFKVVKNLPGDVFASIEGTISTFENPPPLGFVVGRKLDSKHTGYMNFRTGDYAIGSWGTGETGVQKSSPSCALGLIGKSVHGQWSSEITMGLNGSNLTLGVFRSIGWGIRARAAFAVGTGIGLSTSVSADKRISKLDRVGMSVEAAVIGGVSFKLRFIRLGQKFVLPIILSPQLDIKTAALAVVIPLCSAIAIDRLVLEPNRRSKLSARLAKLRSDNAAIIEQRKQEAIAAIQLMAPQVARKREAEELKNGLIIVEAIYGNLVSLKRNSTVVGSYYYKPGLERNRSENGGVSTPSHMVGAVSGESLDQDADAIASEELKWIDVTIPVQALVLNSQLYISGSHSKAHIVGFYDPCLGESKKLRVTYKFQGKLHQVEVDDLNALAAPLRAHTIASDY
ncbi:hypothetical protein HK100_002974 [Physocladia obscura]|uniref:J domain-containing protein n=1 Tax=Physocladia obscura TaxID=109957 RepID=A0AAD5T7Y3_9FUNG|nr:hypothetical protein HK100_002974 [Physocladia obscura]